MDWKTGDPGDVAAELQTAAYLGALLEMQTAGDTPEDLEFDPVAHAYCLGGQRLPSVTQILQWARLIDFSKIPGPILTAAKDRGTAVHKAVHYYNEGDLDVDDFRDSFPEYWPYLSAWLTFRRDSGFEMASELPRNIRRYAIQLRRDGTYRVESYTDPNHYGKFLALVAAWHVAAEFKGAWIEMADVA